MQQTMLHILHLGRTPQCCGLWRRARNVFRASNHRLGSGSIRFCPGRRGRMRLAAVPMGVVAESTGRSEDADSDSCARSKPVAPDAFLRGACFASRGGRMSSAPMCSLFVQQHAFRLFGIDWAVEQFVVFQEDFDEGGARGDGALNQRLRQRVFDVFLQSAP